MAEVIPVKTITVLKYHKTCFKLFVVPYFRHKRAQAQRRWDNKLVTETLATDGTRD